MQADLAPIPVDDHFAVRITELTMFEFDTRRTLAGVTALCLAGLVTIGCLANPSIATAQAAEAAPPSPSARPAYGFSVGRRVPSCCPKEMLGGSGSL